MILKCKMCGGDLPLTDGRTTLECEYCGTRQTIPSADSEKKLTLFNRANRLRMSAEFDKAMGVYESIVTEYPQEAEAYWGLCLCAYGIEYVDDPGTGEKIPTCHRTRPESILDSANFQMACEYADAVAKQLYRSEAQTIDALQRDILTIVAKESPYDVFICYKETGEDGERTQDSVLAQEIYDALTDQGLKVFFARITLEDKLGKEYEPYIYAALHSAKVMLAIGTSYEHFDTVWVKNEWSRFLDMAKEDKGKVLIPCYRDLDAYDLPKAMRGLQAQDMGKLGFLQDIVRGVEKLLGKTAESAQRTAAPVQAAVGSAGVSVRSLMRRAQLFLEDGEWNSADEYLDKVLDIDPEYAPAYIGKLLVSFEMNREEEISAYEEPEEIEDHADWEKAVRFATPEQKAVYEGYLDEAKRAEKLRKEEEEEARREKTYQVLLNELKGTTKAWEYRKIGQAFSDLGDYRDSAARAEACFAKAKEIEEAEQENVRQAKEEEERRRKEEQRRQEEEKRRLAQKKAKRKKCIILMLSVVLLCIAGIELYGWVIEPFLQYSKAEKLFMAEEYQNAAPLYRRAGRYKDAREKAREAYYLHAEKLLAEEKYGEAAEAFQNAWSYNDAEQRANEAYYLHAEKLFEEEKYGEAVKAFQNAGSYGDAEQRVIEAIYLNAEKLLEEGKTEEAAYAYLDIESYKDSSERFAQLAETLDKEGETLLAALSYRKRGGAGNMKRANQLLISGKIAAGNNHTVGLKADGSVVAVGDNEYGQCDVSDWKDIVSVAAGSYHTVGLKADGSVVAVGMDFWGQCEVYNWRNIVSIAAGEQITVGLKADGSVVIVGNGNAKGIGERITFDQAEINRWKNIVSIAAGDSYAVGLKADGSVVVHNNDDDQCEVDDWKGIVSVEAGNRYGVHAIGLKADGSVTIDGGSDYTKSEVSGWKNIVAVAAENFTTIGLKADGSVVGDYDARDWKNIVSIAAGWNHTVGLKADGSVVAVGSNDDGQCNVESWDLGPLR